MTEIPYVTREEVMRVLDVKPSAYMAQQLDRACLTGSRAVDDFCHRSFAPVLATKTFDYPGQRATSQRIWFDQYGLISASEVLTGTDSGTALLADDYLLRPDNSPEEPYGYIELNRSGGASFSGGPQRAVSITGLWGWSNVERNVTALTANVTASSASLAVLAPAGGVGSLLRIGTERMLITGKSWVDSGVTTPALASSASSNVIITASAALFTPFEKLIVDGERMEVLDVYGTSVAVRRAVDGSVLAPHSPGAAIFWEHSVQVERGAAGTVAAAHSSADAVWRWVPPAPINALALAYALDTLLQQGSGYARTAGQGENERPVSGRGIRDLETRVLPYARRARARAV